LLVNIKHELILGMNGFLLWTIKNKAWMDCNHERFPTLNKNSIMKGSLAWIVSYLEHKNKAWTDSWHEQILTLNIRNKTWTDLWYEQFCTLNNKKAWSLKMFNLKKVVKHERILSTL
jgi:hypothetical protein